MGLAYFGLKVGAGLFLGFLLRKFCAGGFPKDDNEVSRGPGHENVQNRNPPSESSSDLPPSSFSPSSKPAPSSSKSPSSTKPAPSSSKPSSSKLHPSSKPPASSSNLQPSSFSPSSKPAPSSSKSPSSPKPAPSSYKPSSSKLSPSSKPPASSSNLHPSSFSPSSKPAPSSSNPPSSPKPASSHKPSFSSHEGLSSSSGPPPFPPIGPPSSSMPPPTSPMQPPAFKPVLHPAPSDVINKERKTSYVLETGTSAIYAIPEDIKGLIKKDSVPAVLKQPLSPSTYKRYFAALLNAEEFYLEKWSDFQLKNVILELDNASIYQKSNKYTNYNGSAEKVDKSFVVFEIDSIPEKRPFLLSRDLVYAQPSDQTFEPFQGIIYRVEKSTCVLVEFGDDFHSQHCSTRKYDISFSFNRVCLKRAHQAVEAASDPLLQNFLFPDCTSRKNILNPPAQFPAYQKLGIDEFAAVHHIISFRGSPPYLLGGSLSVKVDKSQSKEATLSRTGEVVRAAIFEAYKTSPEHRILVCAPINNTCDVLNRSLKKMIPESDMFRANAAFRELDEVPIDILRSCPLEGECFACPSLQELTRFRIILSTFVSSFRLHNEGITAGHFSHIFLVDASSAMEPEAMIPLSNFADDNTAIIVTGAPRNHSGWVRSNIARKHGLRKSYFERLLELRPYRTPNPVFITKLDDFECSR